MGSALLFDLDETLMVEEPAAVAAFAATAEFAATRYEIDPELLASEARSRARELWYAAPTHGYCMRVGISSWEGLWCRFEGDGSDVRALREWSPTYRNESWALALADQGAEDASLAAELAECYGEERRARHEVFADVAKPDASVFQHALDQLGVDSADATIIGDSIAKDVDGALAAGLGAVWVNRKLELDAC